MGRLRGVKHETPIAEYGEQVLYMPLDAKPSFPEVRFLKIGWPGNCGCVCQSHAASKAQTIQAVCEVQSRNSGAVLARLRTP